jgi:hypothetical protein
MGMVRTNIISSVKNLKTRDLLEKLISETANNIREEYGILPVKSRNTKCGMSRTIQTF